MGEEVIEERIKKIKNYITKGKYKIDWIIYGILAFIIGLGYYIRTLNLKLLIDVTTNKYIPMELDSFVILKYARYIVEHGSMMQYDWARYFPIGYNPTGEFGLLSYFIAYLYKILHFFSVNITIEYVDVIYPPIAFALGSIFFFLLVRKVFNKWIALIATAFLTVIPSFLHRTLSGFSDKEALAFTLMFISLYYFVSYFKEENFRKSLIYAGISGLFLGLMGAVWGGIGILLYAFTLYFLCLALWNRLDKKLLYCSWLWFLIFYFVRFIGAPHKFQILSFLNDLPSQAIFFVFLGATIHFVSKDKNRFNFLGNYQKKLPNVFWSFIFSLCFIFFLFIIIRGFNGLSSLFNTLFSSLVSPFSETRWALTVAESKQPYLRDIIGELNRFVFYILFFGLIYCVYEQFRKLNKITGYICAFFYAFALVGILYSRYSPDSVFNGISSQSLWLYFLSLSSLIFVLFYGVYRRDILNKIYDFNRIDFGILFFLVWGLVSFVSARSAIRLLMFLAPIVVIGLGYVIYTLFLKASLLKIDIVKKVVYLLILILFVPLWWNMYNVAAAEVSATGPSYNAQWQFAMQWVRENTPKNAVFAHWWDYGYWVQVGGERATISDGGNARYAINHFVGRYLLTAQNYTDALDLTYANNVSYILMIGDEIGKYPAFSSIGADKYYDRFSWITVFNLDLSKSFELNNSMVYTYSGSYALDDDFLYQGIMFPRTQAGIIGIQVPVDKGALSADTLDNNSISKPLAHVVYNNQLYQIPLNCIFIKDREFTFDGEGLEGCLRILPSVNADGSGNSVGAGLYLSKDVRLSLFAHLYLYDEVNSYFEKVYDGSNTVPLIIYQGGTIGPIKIWKVNYPADQIDKPWMRDTKLPDPGVEKVLPGF
ncbi:MAG TPA: STT3 domain-containing protein [Candidatus Nanoarchaeia archaeon]|nr:STT3 domain-containing protein [Candidatus Nanoarchaeia archaeon]